MALRSDVLLRVAPNDLPDDTEESVLGAEWHQEAIGVLAWSLRVGADRAGASWDVVETVGLDGLARYDGAPFSPRPDVMVLPVALPSKGDANVTLTQVGTPLFVAEVASPSTVINDRQGKREAYAGAGIGEYVIFDPSGERLGRCGVMVEAWRLPEAGARHYIRWEPEEDGAWRSAVLGVRLHVTGLFLQVEDHTGEMVPTLLVGMRERAQAVRERDAERAARKTAVRERIAERAARETAARERDAERTARLQAEQRVRALEEQLRRLQDS